MPKTREVVYAAIIAALYAVFTVALAPLSYGPLQFRIAEILKGLVIWHPVTIPGIVLGTIIANLTSPYVGAWELVWMPITDGLGGVLAWMVARALGRRIGPWLAALCYALTTGAAVGLMLYFVGGVPFWLAFVSVAVSEAVIIVGGLPLMRYVASIWDLRISPPRDN
jgi:uncharacterized membrane protein